MTTAEVIRILKGHKEVEEEWQIEENKPLIEALATAVELLESASGQPETNLQKIDTNVTQYTDGEWIVTIIDSKLLFEAYLGHKDYGIMDLMFGYCSSSLKDFMELVEANLDEYKQIYIGEHFD